MAFPVVESQNPTADSATGGAATSGDTAATFHNCTLPATISAGALILVCGRVAATGAVSVSDPLTFGSFTIAQDSSDGSDDVTFWGYANTLAVGNEDSQTIQIAHGSAKMAAVIMSITGAADPATTPPESGPVATANSATVDPSALAPAAGAKDYLWIWFGGWEGEQTLSKTAATNYTTNDVDVSTGTGGAITINVQIKTGNRQANATSENPGTVSLSAADDWTAWTLAVHPAGAATPKSLLYPAPPAYTNLYTR